YVYERNEATGLSPEPIFIKETLSDPRTAASQGAGAIPVHANGRFVYLTNRTFPAREGGREVSLGGEDNLVVYAIDQNSGEPKPIQHIDGRGVQLRTFGIDASGRLLVAASIMPMLRSDGTSVPAGMTVFRIGADGVLAFARKYNVEVGTSQQFWGGMVALPCCKDRKCACGAGMRIRARANRPRERGNNARPGSTTICYSEFEECTRAPHSKC